MAKRRRPVGRPKTMAARIFIGRHTKQLWISKGAMDYLGSPGRVLVSVQADGSLNVEAATNGGGIAITPGGYTSGESIVTQLIKKFGEAHLRYDAQRMAASNVLKLVPAGRKD